jgi:uncharacterized membrane protein
MTDIPAPAAGRDPDIDAVVDFCARADQKLSGAQRALERASGFAGKPRFLVFILVFVVLWIAINVLLPHLGRAAFDAAPFAWLQGVIGLGALLTASAVLTRQNRLARLEEQRAHLDLKVTLLTEQKTAKLIDLLEELRRDLPNVRHRHDAEAVQLRQPMKPDLVLAALGERIAAQGQGATVEPAALSVPPY